MSDHIIEQGPMDKAYDPAATEERLYDWWESQGFFRPETQVDLGQVDSGAEPFVIAMPPPNVTGALHMGHALTASVEDALVRYNRLRGRPALWIPGTDHAGIATQNVVERALESEGLTRQDLGREAFEDRVWAWKQEYGDRITEQHRQLGVSADWERERFTLDSGLSEAVQEAFVSLYDRGLIYRGAYLVNWCPRCQTVISDIEVEHEETAAKLYEFRYPLEDGGFVAVATTRPETILGDTAVAVHPDDERHAGLRGQTARVPMLDRPIPVIADTYVDVEFGTGALKITPGHDPNDYEIAQRHDLQLINIMNPDGTLNEHAGPYEGLDRFEARKRLWSDMRDAGLVIEEKEHTHALGRCQRCDTVVEPLLSTQWFVKMGPLAEPAIEAVRDGRIRIVPERFTKEYFHWMENIRDWVISRQLWWGHRIPVWYGPDGTAFTGRNEGAAHQRAKDHYGEAVTLTQDPDVLDTWFSSALWPFSTLGWPEDTQDLERFYPTDVLETGYDILFFWVARMIMMGLAHTGEVPFHTVYLHGLVRDSQGRKMSKSLGNAMDPLEVTQEYGTDALRYSLLTGSTPGNDMKLSTERIEGARNFANKLWNIGRFIQSNLPEGFAAEPASALVDRWEDLDLEDRWILSRYSATVADTTRLIEAYQLGEAGRGLFEFLWSELADWYVEAAKTRLYGDDEAAADTVRQVLVNVYAGSLTLLHPYMPFVTEAVWAHLPRGSGGVRGADGSGAADGSGGAEGSGGADGSGRTDGSGGTDWAGGADGSGRTDQPAAPALIVSRWPEPLKRDDAAEAAFGLLRELVTGIRNARAEYNVEPGRRIPAVIAAGDQAEALEAQVEVLCSLARLDEEAVQIAPRPNAPDEAHATVVVGDGVEAWLPLAGMIDLERELARLKDEADSARQEVERLEGVLANESFVSKAPEPVVQRERDRLAEAKQRLGTLEGRIDELQVQ